MENIRQTKVNLGQIKENVRQTKEHLGQTPKINYGKPIIN